MNVLAASVLATVAEVVGNVMVVPSVPVRARELLAVSVLPSAIVSVEPVAGGVRVSLLTVVADAAPRVGVVRVGLVENTRFVEVVPVAPEAV